MRGKQIRAASQKWKYPNRDVQLSAHPHLAARRPTARDTLPLRAWCRQSKEMKLRRMKVSPPPSPRWCSAQTHLGREKRFPELRLRRVVFSARAAPKVS